jgi:hypothetical protein
MNADDQATAELLSALSSLYPLDDYDKRVERAGRTAAVLKRWMEQSTERLAADVWQRLRAGARQEQP